MPKPAKETALREAAERIIERSCREQGIPRHVEDPSVLNMVAVLLLAHGDDESDQTRRSEQLRKAS